MWTTTCKKNCSVCIKSIISLYNVFSSSDFDKVSAPSLLSKTLAELSYLFTLLTQNKIQNIFYMRGLFEFFPPSYVLYSIALTLN